jgi:hypothetical protein
MMINDHGRSSWENIFLAYSEISDQQPTGRASLHFTAEVGSPWVLPFADDPN